MDANGLLDGLTVLAVATTLGVSGVIVWERVSTRQAVGPDVRSQPDWEIYAREGHRIGPANAPVTILEFGDYECPACRAFHHSLQAVKRDYGDSIALVYRHFPLTTIHPRAETAARAAECAAEAGRFAEYHTLLYESTAWQALGAEAFETYAAEVGIADSLGFRRCLFSTDPVEVLQRDREAGIRLGVTATPTILVNDLRLMVFADSIRLRQVVDDALRAR